MLRLRSRGVKGSIPLTSQYFATARDNASTESGFNGSNVEENKNGFLVESSSSFNCNSISA